MAAIERRLPTRVLGFPWTAIVPPTVFGELPLPADWPVYVSQAEAAAYARWVGKQLPNEAEWQRVAYGTPEGADREYPWCQQEPDKSRGNFGFHRWDPTPVAAFPAGTSAFGVADLLGNGWEWTGTPSRPFRGSTRFPATQATLRISSTASTTC
jgi:formylglycine-generating enzyme required for sulfatase activity